MRYRKIKVLDLNGSSKFVIAWLGFMTESRFLSMQTYPKIYTFTYTPNISQKRLRDLIVDNSLIEVSNGL